MYPKAHIPGYLTGEEAHYNFFMGANNTLYWPDDAAYPDSKMKGFRAYFYITPNSGPSALPMRRSMQPVWHIHENTGVVTGVDNIEGQSSIPESKKILRDGQVILVIDGKTYTIGGQIL